MEKILTIIVTYNGQKWIKNCLNSLINSTLPTDIIVIDNCSTDNTVEIIENEFKNIKLINVKQNLGFGKANNIGLKYALTENYDYAFLLNQDAWIDNNCLGNLTTLLEKNPQFGLVSPIHLNGPGNNFDYKFLNFITASEKGKKLIFNAITQNNIIEFIPISFINAACWLLSKKCIEEVGGFNPIFPHYGEDVEFFNRVIKKGFKPHVKTDCYVYHDRYPNKNIKYKVTKKTVSFAYIHEFILKITDINVNASKVINKHLFLKSIKLLLGILTLNRTRILYNFYYLNFIKRDLKQIKDVRSKLKSTEKRIFLK